MTKVGAKYDAPLHDSDGNVLFVTDAPQAAHVNYRTMVALGEMPTQTDFGLEGARAVTDPLNRTGLKAAVLLERLKLLTPEIRETLTRQAEAALKEQTGRDIVMDAAHPSAPLLIWADRANYAFTSDGYAIMGLRSNRNHVAVAQIVPPGIGWASVKDGVPSSPEADARKEFKEEFGLASDNHTPLGNVFTANTVEGYTYESEDKSQWLPGVIPAFSYAGFTKLGKTLEKVIKVVTLNNENFGMVAIHYSKFTELLAGKQIPVKLFTSASDASQEIIQKALIQEADANVECGRTEAMVPPMSVARVRLVATQRDAPRIAATDAEKKPVRYALEGQPVDIVVGRVDFFAVGRNFAPEMVHAAAVAGLPVRRETAAHAKQLSQFEPVMSMNKAFGARPDHAKHELKS